MTFPVRDYRRNPQPLVIPAGVVPPADADGDFDGTVAVAPFTAEQQQYLRGPGGPLWWLQRLEMRLWEKQLRTAVYWDYYHGNHRLRFASAKFRETFGGLFAEFADNACRKVVDVVNSRLRVTGFNVDPRVSEGDEDAWTWWQASHMDEKSRIAHRASMIGEEAAAGVWWGPDGMPQIVVMDPTEVVVQMSDDGVTREAAMRQWVTPSGDVRTVVYTPDFVWKFRGGDNHAWQQQHDQFLRAYDRPGGGAGRPGVGSLIIPGNYLRSAAGWIADITEGEAWPLPNVLGVVPVVPLVNRSRINGDGESELRDIIPVQDALNKTVLDAMVNSEFTAFSQRWYIGTVPKDALGNPTAPFPTGAGLLAYSEDPQAKFGEFRENSGTHLKDLVETLVGHLAFLSDVPGHYFSGLRGTQFPSGDALRAAEAGLTSKAREKGASFGEAWLEVIRLCYLVRGRAKDLKKAQAATAECLWMDPEEFTRSESAHLDALAKMIPLGVPGRLLRARAGVTPAEEMAIPDLLAAQAQSQVDFERAVFEARKKAGLLAIAAPPGAPPDAGGADSTGAPAASDAGAGDSSPKPGIVLPGEPGSPVGVRLGAARVST